VSGEKPIWERVPQGIKFQGIGGQDGTLLRLHVEGGWIYRWSNGGLSAESICFAPESAEPRLCGHGYIHATCGDCRLR
jgi:hypothetical protein